MVLEKTLENPLDFKEIQPVHPKGDQSWVLIGGTDVEAETPVLRPLMRRADSFEKTLMLLKIEGERRRRQQRMRWLDGNTILTGLEFEQSLGVGDGQGSLGCCNLWYCKELDMTEQLNYLRARTSLHILTWACASMKKQPLYSSQIFGLHDSDSQPLSGHSFPSAFLNHRISGTQEFDFLRGDTNAAGQ